MEPSALFLAAPEGEGLIWLDSAMQLNGFGRWSYIMRLPFTTFSGSRNTFTLKSGGKTDTSQEDPFATLEKLLAGFQSEPGQGAPPFTGGAAGFLGYELLRWTEPSTKIPERSAPEGDIWIGFYDEVIAFDRENREISLICNTEASSVGEVSFDGLERWIDAASKTSSSATGGPSVSKADLKSDFTEDGFVSAVEKVRGYIEKGDCYQANIAQRFTMPAKMDSKALYMRLREASPAPFGAYIDTGAVKILSSSPERFMSVNGDTAQSRPIKGTRPRGKDEIEDARLAQELAESDKEKAENLMIVDLLRNDLSRVCAPETVKVTGLFEVEKFANVIHLTSTIEGRLKPGVSRADLLRASFPCGSVTGAPKIRAMEIIGEIEPHPRGVYCGAIGYMGFGGGMDLSVGIRVMTLDENGITFHSGSGVTYPSNAREEYEETLHKAKGMMEAAGVS